jgi:subtilase family serine protease
MGSFRKFSILFIVLALPYAAAQADGLTPLTGHVPVGAMARAIHLGREASSEPVQMSVGLTLRNQGQLNDLIKKLYDPNDPLFHQFLSVEAFKSQFAPTDDDVNQVTAYLISKGLRIKKVHANHLLIEVEGASGVVESAFQIELHEYITDKGRIAYAPTSNPLIADEMASKMNTIVGLSTFAHWNSHARKNPNQISMASENPQTSVGSYMTPAKIKSAYNLASLTQTGAGESIALFELDGYTPSDITTYANYFSLTAPTLQNILVSGATGTPGSGAEEVTLDIELAAAIAPGATKILVYEGPNTAAGVIATYSQIHSDGLAFEVSTSWGESENEMTGGEVSQENTIFSAMATSGQSIFAAAGDSGAYDDSVDNKNGTLEVDDPGSQPYVTSVGGTHITLNGSNGWASETSWVASAASGTYGQTSGQNAYTAAEGGGGGISLNWTTTSYQPSNLATAGNKGSTTHRMVPDVSLNADPSFGYPIYEGGSWGVYGGTSCAAPLWAAFTALVNQSRVAHSLPRIGFVNPAVYAIGTSSNYSTAFHDIADGSTNLYYPATTGYDLTTGWGSFNGGGLFTLLATATSAPYAPSSVTTTAGTNSVTVSWSSSLSATSYTISRSTTANGTYTELATNLNALQYTDATAAYGTVYDYEITATNSYGTSAASAPVSGEGNPPAPTAPGNLTATLVQ